MTFLPFDLVGYSSGMCNLLKQMTGLRHLIRSRNALLT
ncbi:hypothetical protein D1BOALGB6SA_4257 [Olavius sp. associated proteobacterium Delta 1]|nr:hypothetical protein D1BOALGB6SA_4257 [Olavius sp. associated proteobacterium Delta 1]